MRKDKISLNKFILIFLILLFVSQTALSQLTQTVHGKVVDKVSGSPLPGVNVILLSAAEKTGVTTDLKGGYVLKDVSVGRNSFQFSYVGYETVTIGNLIVYSGKELNLDIEMIENVSELEEITVSAYNKGEVLNKMASISARSFSIEETDKYAGSWADPARMAKNFAGITSTNDTRNDIIIRGNSPGGLLWRLEGVDIPNPNHFAVQGTSGGPVSMLNNNLLTRSDFFTGAFPAEYGNALSGVFDLNMRNGNNSKTEYVLQVALNGFEGGIEGPLFKKNKGSYLINYRYAFLDVLQNMGLDIAGGVVPSFTDLSYKFNVPTKKLGTFSLFGLGGLDDATALANQSTDEFNPVRNTNLKCVNQMGVTGLNHKIIFGDKANLQTSVSTSGQYMYIGLDTIMPDNTKLLFYSSRLRENQYTASTRYTHKLDSRNTFSAGLSYKDKSISQKDKARVKGHYITIMFLEDEHLRLLQGFVEWKHRFTNEISFYSGLFSQYLFLNNTKTIEPRLGFNWNIDRQHSLNFGYGIHSQTQSLPLYFHMSHNEKLTKYWYTCKELDLTKSQHFIVGYNNKFASDWNLKIEGYYQYIWDVPVEHRPSSFSALNLGATYFNGVLDQDSLVNEGLGSNKGVEITLEKYLNSNWYLLFTASLFESLFMPSDGIWRNTVFSTNYVSNALVGYEFTISKRTSLNINLRVAYSGGIRQRWVDREASVLSGETIYDDFKSYSVRSKDYFKIDSKLTLSHNFNHVTLDVSAEVLNITDEKNIFSETFDPKTGTTSYTYQQGVLPTAILRLTF